jgi:hypothetical protein
LAVPWFLKTIEETCLSVWIRESPSIFAFYGILTVHTLGLVLLVGLNAVVSLRLLGAVRGLAVSPLKNYFAFMWMGFWLNFASGVLLLVAYPTKSVTNPLFYVKLLLIAAGLILMQRMNATVFGDPGMSDAAMETQGRRLAIASLAVWLGTITAGRFLAYTYRYLLYGAG